MGTSYSPGSVHVRLYPIDPALVDPSINKLPSVDPSKYIVLDDDAKVCASIGEDELHGSYVDENIDHYQLDGMESWIEAQDPDRHNVILTYSSGKQVSILVGSISLDSGPAPDHYFKTEGIIYPIDKNGAALLDNTNTPALSYIRNQYWAMAKKQAETNLMFAEMVASFAGAVAALGHAGEASNYVTAPDIDGNIPTPAETPANEVDSPDGQASGSGSN